MPVHGAMDSEKLSQKSVKTIIESRSPEMVQLRVWHWALPGSCGKIREKPLYESGVLQQASRQILP